MLKKAAFVGMELVDGSLVLVFDQGADAVRHSLRSRSHTHTHRTPSRSASPAPSASASGPAAAYLALAPTPSISCPPSHLLRSASRCSR